MDEQIAKRNLSFILYGGQEEFEAFMQVKEWLNTTQVVQSLPEFHSFDLEQIFEHVELQQRETVKYVRKLGGMRAASKHLSHFSSLLGFDAGRFILVHSYFTNTLQALFPKQPLLKQADQAQILGSILFNENDFDKKQVLRYYKDDLQTKLHRSGSNFTISTTPGIPKSGLYYASNLTSYAIVLCSLEGKHYLALTKLKHESGQLVAGVNLMWLGKSLQLVNNWAVELKDVAVLQVVELESNWREQLQILEGTFLLQESRIQLQDLMRLAFIAVKYTHMRKQFKSMDEDKTNERRVIEYQVTTSRLLNAISFAVTAFLALGLLQDKYQAQIQGKRQERYPFSIFAKQFTQLTIKRSFELIEILRECMGGYGYLRFSGAPTIQERSLWLCQQQCQDLESSSNILYLICKDLEKNQRFVNSINGVVMAAQDPIQMLVEVGPINESTAQNPFALYGYYVAKTRQRFLNVGATLHPDQVMQMSNDIVHNFIGIQFFNLLAFRRFRGVNLILDQLFLHQVSNEILVSIENYIQKYEDNLKHRQVIDLSRTKIHQKLREQLILIVNSLEQEGSFYDALIGSDNEKEFYEYTRLFKVLRTLIDMAKNHNQRNDPKIEAYILEDLKNYMQRPKL